MFWKYEFKWKVKKLSPSSGPICGRDFLRVAGNVYIYEVHIIWNRCGVWGIHQQGRLHNFWTWSVFHRAPSVLGNAIRRWRIWELCIFQLALNDVFVFSNCVHLLSSWHKRTWPVFRCPFFTVTMVVEHIVMISWRKLQSIGITFFILLSNEK